MGSIPLQRSKKLLEEDGWKVWRVEQWVPWPPPGHRLDMYNLMDLVAIKSDVNGVLGIQCCADSGISAHVKKALENPYLSVWKGAGNGFRIWGWGKKGERGKRKVWTLREVVL